MSDALSAIPAAVHRNLSDKLYEKRKNAALDVLCHLCFFLFFEFLLSLVLDDDDDDV